MKHILSILLLLLTAPVYAGETANEHLLVLAPFIGTWKAEVAENTYDVSHYDWILGGKALRIMQIIQFLRFYKKTFCSRKTFSKSYQIYT